MTAVSFVTREPIRILTQKGAMMVDSARIGHLAVNILVGAELLDGSQLWGITHVASGMRLDIKSLGGALAFKSEDDALACMRVLLALPVDWADILRIRRREGFAAFRGRRVLLRRNHP